MLIVRVKIGLIIQYNSSSAKSRFRLNRHKKNNIRVHHLPTYLDYYYHLFPVNEWEVTDIEMA